MSKTSFDKKGKKSVKFSIGGDDQVLPDKKTFRTTLYPKQDTTHKSESFQRSSQYRSSSQLDRHSSNIKSFSGISRNDSKSFIENDHKKNEKLSTFARRSTRLTQMFSKALARSTRTTIVLRPDEIYLPTYRLESKNPFNVIFVESFLSKYLENRLDSHGKFEFQNAEAMNSLNRRITQEILEKVKSYEYDRYKIIVASTISEKRHQLFTQKVAFLWDAEIDCLASYVYERGNVFAMVNVFGIYYD